MTAYRTIVVGTDGSASSLVAVESAGRLAAACTARLVIVCAYAPLPRQVVERAQDVLGDEAYQVVGSAPAESTLQTAREHAVAAGAVDVENVAVEGEPVAALVRATRDHSAELLVVGNRGLRSLAGRILGSVPSDVSRKARVDVLIVHTT
ncbi:universal stress protein [Streptomyces sp. TRM 70351]|uniref:universal stress protein n=1 Tax=Streptomyces sp. TRM 70351 TaxID=3116552 RepID=UPI002E7B0FDA|nr:universal stress protein [Streptomyces sp. TRM 70351]MEE1930887.1 universal stress protein [Streptomyces sp. TRM 70351]